MSFHSYWSMEVRSFVIFSAFVLICSRFSATVIAHSGNCIIIDCMFLSCNVRVSE